MSKNMLIDAAHLEEIRVAVVNGETLDKFDCEPPSKTPIKGNIYLGKVVRVEPSLQAAFVDCGNGKHGFLSFSEVHHDYFQIPVEDRKELEDRIHSAMSAHAEEIADSEDEIDAKEIAKLRYQFYRRYKIQEVIKKRQIMLVQVTKEERGTKGAALTTYISLAGRYCVLMPNMSRGSGVSRKISNLRDREKLKKIVAELNVENGSAVIRTAGVGHSKTEIKKDFDYLKKNWDEIRAITLKSTAPCLIHEEANIIKRAIRDLYSRDIESIIVEGEEGYKIAKAFVKKLIPSHSKKVKLYDDSGVPLFSKFKVNDQINQMYTTRVDLLSGGYIIINTTEALVSIDVNSGKSTKERNIGGTALKTNLEAAVEIARQCQLRDLAGLIVVDFIDMDDKRNNTQVERCLREALREDKAKIQVGAISNFGLLEFSRQRLRSSIADANMVVCPHCNGIGAVWSDESIALQILRKIEETCVAFDWKEVDVVLSMDVALYLLNKKRNFIESIEKRGIRINFDINPQIAAADFKISQKINALEDEHEQHNTVRSSYKFNKGKKNKKNEDINIDIKNNDNDELSNIQEDEQITDSNATANIEQQNNHDYVVKSKNKWNKRRIKNNRENMPVDLPAEGATELMQTEEALVDNNSKQVFNNPTKNKLSKNKVVLSENSSAVHDYKTGKWVKRKNARGYRAEKSTNINTDATQTITESELYDIVDKNTNELNNESTMLAQMKNSNENSTDILLSETDVNITKKSKKSGWWKKLISKPEE